MKEKNFKNHIVRAIAIISIFSLMAVIVLPGCNFIGQTSLDTNNVSTPGASNVGITENTLCCPVCSSTNITGPDADGYYVCNDCAAKWTYDEEKIDVVDKNGELITQLDASAGYVDYGSSGSSGSSGSGNAGSNTTKKTTTKSQSNVQTTTKKTTTKSVQQQLNEINERWKDVIKLQYNEETGDVTVVSPTGKDTGLFGFKYSTKDQVFYTAEDAWQRNFGYEESYDQVSGVGAISYDTIRVKFNYNNLEYMIQFWKGQYGFVFIGSEIGVYHRPAGSAASTYYQCATDETKLVMSMNVYKRESSSSNTYNLLFFRSPANTWWLTGFTPGTLRAGNYVIPAQYTGYLKVDATIHFKDTEMAQGFISGLKNVTLIEHNSPSSKRAFSFTEVSAENYDATTKNGKFALEEDGTSVRVCWR